jgi:3-oxoacyl-[acyl-carrier-protein] synthase II
MTRSVVITGVGAVTPLGVGARTLHERWSAGVSGIEDGFGRATEFEPKEHLSVKEVRRSDRFTQLALAAAREALDDAGWNDGSPRGSVASGRWRRTTSSCARRAPTTSRRSRSRC